MRIAVLGATGMVGRATVTEGLARGHHITAVARTPRDHDHHDRLEVRRLDVAVDDVAPVLAEVDAAVLALRSPAGQEHLVTGLTTAVLDAAATTGTRVLVVGGSGPLTSPYDARRRVVDEPNLVPDPWQPIARASIAQLGVCRDHHHQGWTYLSPPAVLEPGARIGRYRRGSTVLLTDDDGQSRISAADLAIAVVDELEDPSGMRHFTVVSG